MIGVVSSCGRLASQIVDQLLAQGLPPEKIVAAGSCSYVLTDSTTESAINKRPIDSNDCRSAEAAFADVDTLILIPASDSSEPAILQHSQMIAAAKTANVRRVLLLSLCCARPDSQVLMTPFLLYAESALRSSGLEWLILRRALCIDALAEWAPQLSQWGELPYPGHGSHCSYVSRLDVARATAAAARKPSLQGEVLELTGPAAIAIPEVANVLSRLTGNSIEFRSITADEFLQRGIKEGETESETERRLSLCRGIDGGEFARATDHIERLTGEPAESIFVALKRLLAEHSQEQNSI